MKPFERTFYYSALAFAFTLPLSRAAISFFIIWFVVLFLAQRNYKASWERIKTNRAFMAMGAFFALLALSVLWSQERAEALNQLRLYGYWIIIPILAVTLKREWLPNIVTAFLGGMFVSEILSYGIYFELWTIKNATPEYPTPFMSHIHYSVFLAFTAVILLSRLLSDRYTWRSKIPMMLFFLTSTGNLMLSTGRTGQLAFVVAMAVAVVFHYRLTLRALALFAVLSTLLSVGAYTSVDPFKQRVDQGVEDIRQLQGGNYDTSWGLRAAFWIVTVDILREHPLLGIGIGDYKRAAAEALARNDHGFSPATIEWCGASHFHNQYLMILAQIGLIGFGLMAWLLLELFRLKIADRELKEFSVLGLTVFAVASMAEPLWILQFPIILFVLVVSVSLAGSIRTSTSAMKMEKCYRTTKTGTIK